MIAITHLSTMNPFFPAITPTQSIFPIIIFTGFIIPIKTQETVLDTFIIFIKKFR